MNNSDIIATTALVIALLAMIATFWQAHAARAFGRISVRPHLDWGINRFPGKPVILYLSNSGLGPAVIDSITLTLDGRNYPIDNMELPKEIRDEVMSIGGLTEWVLFSKGTPISSGTQINLFSFQNQSLNQSSYNRAITLLERIGVEIDYSSMYKEKFKLRRTVESRL